MKRKNEWMSWSRRILLNRGAVDRQIAGNRALEDPEIVKGDFGEGLGRNAEVLGEHRRRRMSKPVGDEQGVEFVGMTVVKTDDEFASVRPKALQRVRSAGRKIPEIAGLHIADIGPSLRIEDSHPAIAVGDRKSTRLNSSHRSLSRMPSSA